MQGKVHHFGAVGYANGLTVISDEETRTLWDHITGEAFEGPLQGTVLETWPIFLSTVEAELKGHPETLLLPSTTRTLGMWVMKLLSHLGNLRGKGFLPPTFYRSMTRPIDPRLPKLTQGLGVVVEGKAKFYPWDAIPQGSSIEDPWGDRILRVERGAINGIPTAMFPDAMQHPMQLSTRWYGFSFTYPSCAIYEAEPRL